MYGERELGEIRDAISGKHALSEADIALLRARFQRDRPLPALAPFLGLAATNPDVYAKLAEDPRVRTYSHFGFFPETYPLVYGSEQSPSIRFERGNRGTVGILFHPALCRVVKPTQSPREAEIARIAHEVSAGPAQYPTLDTFLTEEYLPGTLFTQLLPERAGRDELYRLGRRMGDILTSLHARNVYYNDTTLADDFGRSHIMVAPDGVVRLFDYGVALNLERHPDVTDDAVLDFARTIPLVNALWQADPSPARAAALIADYRPIVGGATTQMILTRDIDFMHEGLQFASYRLGDRIMSPFLSGFNERYKQ